MEVQFQAFLTSALDVDGWLDSRPRCFAFVVRASSYLCGLRTWNELFEEGNIFFCRNRTTSVDSWPLITGVPVQSRASQCGLYGEETGNRTEFPPSNSVVLLEISTNASYGTNIYLSQKLYNLSGW